MIGFLLSLRASGRSPKTEKTYRESLLQLHAFMSEMGMPSVENLTAENLRHYLMALYKKGNKPASVSNRYRALKSYYKWLVNEGERQDNPLSRISPPKVPETIQKHYTVEEVSRLLLSCSGNAILDLRDRAIILVLLDTGLRSQELCDMRIEDVDLKRMTLHVQSGKGGKARVVGLGYKSAQAVERFLRKRAEYTYLANSHWLFPSWYGEALTYNGLTLMLRRRFKKAGLEFVGAHAFRRGFAISYLESGGSPEDLRVLAGWDSPQMLRRYTRATERERALNGHRLHSPADRLR